MNIVGIDFIERKFITSKLKENFVISEIIENPFFSYYEEEISFISRNVYRFAKFNQIKLPHKFRATINLTKKLSLILRFSFFS